MKLSTKPIHIMIYFLAIMYILCIQYDYIFTVTLKNRQERKKKQKQVERHPLLRLAQREHKWQNFDNSLYSLNKCLEESSS